MHFEANTHSHEPNNTQMHMRKFYRCLIRSATVLTMVMVALSASAQKKVVTGTVTDPQGSPIPGVNVIIKGTTTGTATDAGGDYSIEASETDVLQFSFIGFSPTEAQVGSRTRIDIQMEEDVATLQEVVIVGYGEMRRADLTTAQTSISSKDIERTAGRQVCT